MLGERALRKVGSAERTWLDCPFKEKDEVKARGASYDKDRRQWVLLPRSRAQWKAGDATERPPERATRSSKAGPGLQAERPGSRWYVPAGMDLAGFAAWRPVTAPLYLDCPFAEKDEAKVRRELGVDSLDFAVSTASL